MKNVLYLPALLLLLLLGSSGMAWAQDDFNPANPAEPGASSIKYRLSVRVEPAGAGSASGAGLYTAGTQPRVSTSATNGYVFECWKDGDNIISTDASFYYTTTAASKTLVAQYRYDPVSPSEPNASHDYRLYLTTNIEGACSFNTTSGLKRTADNYVSLTAYVSPGYDFLGWYQNGVLVNEGRSFNYLMPFATTTLEARTEFNPSSPGEPSSTPYTHRGDVNEDGVVDVTDAVKVINVYLSGDNSTVKMSVADMNQDRTIDVTDAVAIINKYLRNE